MRKTPNYNSELVLLRRYPPEMWLSEISVIIDCFKNLKHDNPIEVCEWGSGNSTIFFPCYLLNQGIKYHWTSIEHFVPWFDIVRRGLADEKLENIDYALVDSTMESDKDKQRKQLMVDYINFPLSLNKKFDVVFIDGRKRLDCLKVASRVVKPDGMVFLHDAERVWYHKGFKFYKNGGCFVTSNICEQAFGGVQKLWVGKI